jgi:ribonuclease VapC
VTVGVVVDTSAVVAVLQAEAGSAQIVAHLAEAGPRLMSTAARVELGIVVEARFGAPGRDLVDRFLRDAAVELVDVTAEMAERAVSAWRRYGKGRHAAGLNFGDCFAYALADHSGFPLLCTGEDFAATDLEIIR